MFRISNDTYMEKGYLIEIVDDIYEFTVILTQEDSINPCFQYTFKLYGHYVGQMDDLVEDAIGMYERTLEDIKI
jgi:hypothetical protein